MTGATPYGVFFDNDPDGLVVLDPGSGQVRDCNQRYSDLTGRAKDEIIGTELTGLTSGDRHDSSAGPSDRSNGRADDIVSALERSNGETLTGELHPESGDAFPVDVRSSTVTADGDSLLLVRVSAVVDHDGDGPSGQHTARNARAVDEAPIGITLTDPDQEDNPVVYVNDAFCEMTGYAKADVLGRNCRFLQGEGTDPEPVAEMREAIDDQRPVTVELRNYRKDGTEFWNRVTVAPVSDETGDVTNYVGFQEDITDRKRYEQELELSHRLLETVQSGVFRTEATPDGTVEYANPALASLLGADSPDQLEEYCVAEFYTDPDVRSELLDALRSGEDSQVKREVTLERLDGEQIDVVVTASLAEDETGTEYLHKVVQDITKRKEREQRLERYERLVETLPLGVYQNTPGPEGEFTFLNQGMVDLFDAESKAQLRNRPVRDLYVDPADRDAFSDELSTEGVVTDREIQLETLDGDHLWGAVTAIVSTVDGQTVFDGVIQDITERKEYEQRLKEQRDNLTVLNQMLRHDIRNDLQVVTAYANLLGDMVDEDGREHLETITESTDHAVELTRTAREIAEVMLSTDENYRAMPLDASLSDELDEVRSEYSSAVVTVDGAIPDVSVTADEMVTSVFRNILQNAIQHNDREVPEVRVTGTAHDETVVIRIADDGPGIPNERKSDVFGKGETGLESEGSGMGLYLVETLVENYGGDVWVEDNEPRGAVFVIELPRAGE
ncbi:PAS domain-containing protein [Halovenus marina]|uniref:PAS domain-containing protein n=1 Tax=Halovenus marina TaxID=3396621 RepID=UPI003F560A82